MLAQWISLNSKRKYSRPVALNHFKAHLLLDLFHLDLTYLLPFIGLISAAKVVGIAANLLVDAADRCVTGDAKMEELIVASQEISAATAQLLVASKVCRLFLPECHFCWQSEMQI